jgi:hypothetical protein
MVMMAHAKIISFDHCNGLMTIIVTEISKFRVDKGPTYLSFETNDKKQLKTVSGRVVQNVLFFHFFEIVVK